MLVQLTARRALVVAALWASFTTARTAYPNTIVYVQINTNPCPYVPVATRFDRAGAVLLGQVTEVKGSWAAGLPETATLTVIRSWKGSHSAGELLKTSTPCTGKGCVHLVDVGDVVLVFSIAAGPKVNLNWCSVFKGDEANSMVALLDSGRWRSPLQCMVEVLKKIPDADEVQSGVLNRASQVHPFVQYRYREEDGDVGTVTFVAENSGASKVPTYFSAFLSGRVPPGMTEPRAYGTREIVNQWRLQCGVAANVIWP